MAKLHSVIQCCLLIILAASAVSAQVVATAASADSEELLAPSVFDARIYAAIHPNLASARLTTSQLQQDWLANGIRNCLRASAAFDPKQYLQMYPALKTETGGDCTHATLDFIRKGSLLGRHGTATNSTFGGVVIDAAGRSEALFGNEQMTIHASARFGFAIDSIVFRGKEFIDSWDHGRELQWAWNNFGMGECNNPTEAGSQDDFQKPTSTTNVISMGVGPLDGTIASTNGLSTTVFPAYWLHPGQTTQHCAAGSARPNQTLVDKEQPTSKHVTLGFLGNPSIIAYEVTIDNKAEAVPDVTVEAPTGYLADDFDRFYAFLGLQSHAREIDMEHWHATPSLDAGETPYPIILATADRNYAMGVFSPDQLGQAPVYGVFHFKHGKDSPQKWNVSYRGKSRDPSDAATDSRLPQGKTTFNTYLVLGNLTEVEQGLATLTAKLRSSGGGLLFEEEVYRALHPIDANLSWIALSDQWRKSGLDAGLRASLIYDPAFYKAERARNGQPPVGTWSELQQSFLTEGLDRGIRASLEFDPQYYVKHNPELTNNGSPASPDYFAAARQWLRTGLNEGQDGSADFSPTAYLHRYPDVQKLCGPKGFRCAALHWLTIGVVQGRNGKT